MLFAACVFSFVRSKGEYISLDFLLVCRALSMSFICFQ